MKVATIVLYLLATGLALAIAPSATAAPWPCADADDGPTVQNPLNDEYVFYFCNGWTGGYPNCTYQDFNVAPGAVLTGTGVITVSSKGEACGGNCLIYGYLDIYLCDTDISDGGSGSASMAPAPLPTALLGNPLA